MFKWILIAGGARSLGAVAAVVMTAVGWGLLATAVYASGGVVMVKVEDRSEGFHLTLPVPSVIVSAAVATADQIVPDHEKIHIEAQLGEWGPYVEGVLRALDDTPDVVLVEVREGDEHIVVRKSGKNLEVDVNSSDITVHVSVPTKLVWTTVSTLIG